MKERKEISLRHINLNEMIAKLDYELIDNPDTGKQEVLDAMHVELKTLRWVLDHMGIEPMDYHIPERGIKIMHVGCGSGRAVQEAVEQLAILHATGQPPRIILVDDSPRAETIADVFNEPLIMKLSNYRIEDYILTTPKYDGSSGSKFIKPNSTKNWKK